MPNRKIFDCFLFFNELDLLEKRLEILYEHVDYFIIGESKETFSGSPKELYYKKNEKRFYKYKNKIIHYIVPLSTKKNKIKIIDNPHTNVNKSYEHKHGSKKVKDLNLSVQREIYQRDELCIPLKKTASKKDIILLSDLDEIPRPRLIDNLRKDFSDGLIYHFSQIWYMYWINNQVVKEWFGTRAFTYEKLINKSMDYYRFPTETRSAQDGIILDNAGWHFSYLGGHNMIEVKLSALAFQGYRSLITIFLIKLFPGYLKKMLARNADILNSGRKFKLIQKNTNLPDQIKDDEDFIKKYSK